MASVWGELKRRNVVKVAVAYAIVGWLLVQIADIFFPALQLPEWTVTFVAGLVLLGFPIALILSWAYELTPDGMERTKSVPLSESISKVTGRKLDFAIIGALVLALGFVVYNYESENALGPDPEIVVDEVVGSPPPVVEEQREVLPNSVAVLPFANLSPDPDNAYYAAGIHEEILNQLVKIRGLNVIARTSVMQYADAPPPILQIAEELNVQTVMEGSVRYAGGQIRITTQLNDGVTGAHIWSETYTRDFNDIFAIESDVAMNVANALEAKFSLAERESIDKIPTESREAYAYYLRALSTPVDDALTDAMFALLDQAITADSNFALAYASKAYQSTIMLLGLRGGRAEEAAEWERLIRENATRALELDLSLGIAHAALATLHQVNWRGTEAEQAFQRANELSPNDVDVLVMYGRFKRYRGEHVEAMQLLQRARELDPNSTNTLGQLALNYRNARNWDAAAEVYRNIFTLRPVNDGNAIALALVEAMRDNSTEALRLLAVAEQFVETNSFRLAQMASVYSILGRSDDAQRIFIRIEEMAEETTVGDAVWSQAYGAIGDYEQALKHLELAVTNRAPTDTVALAGLAVNYFVDPRLDAPDFRQLLDGLWDDR
jgi:TolB-like protein/Tfp pilus assembly protein PilF